MELFGNQEFYTFDGVKYVNTFPQEWASNHLDETGPKNCISCKFNGSLCDVFIMYCTNCAIYEYGGKRGLGGYFPASENTFMDLYAIKESREILNFIKINGFVSASTSYLKNVPLECARYGHKMLEDLQKELEKADEEDEEDEEDEFDYLPDLIPYEEAMEKSKEEKKEQEEQQDQDNEDMPSLIKNCAEEESIDL